MLEPGFKALSELFNDWFSGWEKITEKNYAAWARRDLKNRPRDPEKDPK